MGSSATDARRDLARERDRTEGGQFEPFPITDDYCAAILLKQRAGATLRELVEETGRSLASIKRDLREARRRERIALGAAQRKRERSQVESPADSPAGLSEPVRRPGASVLVLDAAGLHRADGQVVASASAITIPKPRYREGLERVLEDNERDRLLLQAYVLAGLDAHGFATFQTPHSRGSYDPEDTGDVERVRKIIRHDLGEQAAADWQPHPGIRGKVRQG